MSITSSCSKKVYTYWKRRTMMLKNNLLFRHRKIHDKWTIGMVFAFVMLSIYFILVFFPLIWMVLSALKTEREFFNNLWGFPAKAQWSNYSRAWEMGISRYFFNSVFVTSCSVLLCLTVASLAAFAFTYFKFKGDTTVFVLCMGGMMLSPLVTLIPLYKIIQAIHIHNTYWAMIFPIVSYRMPITLLVIRSYFLGIPKEIHESAKMDGCNSFTILWRLYIPISKPILLTSAILVAYFTWNEFLFSIMFVDSRKFKTIPAGLMVFRDVLNTNYALLFAGLTLASIPMILIFLFMQRHFIRGITAGAVKA